MNIVSESTETYNEAWSFFYLSGKGEGIGKAGEGEASKSTRGKIEQAKFHLYFTPKIIIIKGLLTCLCPVTFLGQ